MVGLPLLLSLRCEPPSIGQLLVCPLLEPFFQQHYQLAQHVDATAIDVGSVDVAIVVVAAAIAVVVATVVGDASASASVLLPPMSGDRSCNSSRT